MALVAAMTIAVVVGFALAIVVPAAAALYAPWGLRWRALAQVHGHVMVVGWIGFFIMGMAVRLLPRFSASPLRYAPAADAAFILIALALAVRLVAQPLADARLARAMLPVSGALEVAGTVLFALSAIATLKRPLGEGKPFAFFLAAGSIWFVVQAVLTARALLLVFRAGDMVIAGADDAPALQVQFYGFLVCFITGVSLRAIPTFFAWKTPVWLAWAAWGALQLGIGLIIAASLFLPIGDGWLWQDAGRLLVAVALLAIIGCMGIWRPASRLRGGVQPVALLLRSAYGWLSVAALLLVWGAVQGSQQRAIAPFYADDAARHLLALGVISMLVVGMAYLVAPMFAQERTGGRAMTVRVRLYAVLLGAAALLRAAGALLEPAGATSARYWAMTAAGVLGMAAVALFGWRLVHGIRHPYVPVIAVRDIAVQGPISRPPNL